MRGVAAGKQCRGGRSPEAAEESGCSWRVGNRFISPILLEIFSGYAAFPSFLGQLVQLLGLCGIKFHLLCWSILEGCPIRRADHDIQSALSGLRIAKVPAKPGAPGCGRRCGFSRMRAGAAWRAQPHRAGPDGEPGSRKAGDFRRGGDGWQAGEGLGGGKYWIGRQSPLVWTDLQAIQSPISASHFWMISAAF